MIIKLILMLLGFLLGISGAQSGEYVVQKGDYLVKIAKEHDVSWQALLLANEAYLKQRYEETCGRLKERYTHSKTRRGHFCNAHRTRAYANTLKRGWKLALPAKEATREIAEAVSAIVGAQVVLVIDDTGSMLSNRQRVSQLYLAALRQYKKVIIGVFLYADGHVRRYEVEGVSFQRYGDRENTFGALQEAAKLNPDHIILISDEQGDDWQWDKVTLLPPVTAHCLPSGGHLVGCEETLARLARETKGHYRGR